jgi:hypothetical protein
MLVAACGDDPLVIFRVSSTTEGATGSIQVCEPGMTCTGMLAAVLEASDRASDGALFEVPAGVVEVPIQVLQGGTASASCKRKVVSLAESPVELTITVGAAAPTIDCPTGVDCGALEDCCNNLGVCTP